MTSGNYICELALTGMAYSASDNKVRKEFLRAFSIYDNLFMLDQNTLNAVEQNASKGNVYALFLWGRWHFSARREKDSVKIAEECFRKAYEAGMPEAGVSLAQMYRYGDLGIVDREKALELIEEAREKGCDFAEMLRIKDWTFGLFGEEIDYVSALFRVEQLIKRDEKDGDVNPIWYYLRGCIKQQVGNYADSRKDLEIAAAEGIPMAWSDLVVVTAFNEDGELVSESAYRDYLRLGERNGSALCSYMLVAEQLEEYETLPAYTRLLKRKEIEISLSNIWGMGSWNAAETLGEMYETGIYDTLVDYEKARTWYKRAADLGSPSAYEALYALMKSKKIECSLNEMDRCALDGVRTGSEELIDEVVAAYKAGRLQEFTAEIENYYIV